MHGKCNQTITTIPDHRPQPLFFIPQQERDISLRPQLVQGLGYVGGQPNQPVPCGSDTVQRPGEIANLADRQIRGCSCRGFFDDGRKTSSPPVGKHHPADPCSLGGPKQGSEVTRIENTVENEEKVGVFVQDVRQGSIGKRLQVSGGPLMATAWSQGVEKRGGFIRKRNSVLTGQDVDR